MLLVVDDEALILHLVSDALEGVGFSTVQAASGEEAIEALRDPVLVFSGLVTNVNIGNDVTGWEVARVARESSAEMPVVYMTGDSAREWAAQGVPNSLMVSKPFAVSQIITAMSQLLNDVATQATGIN